LTSCVNRNANDGEPIGYAQPLHHEKSTACFLDFSSQPEDISVSRLKKDVSYSVCMRNRPELALGMTRPLPDANQGLFRRAWAGLSLLVPQRICTMNLPNPQAKIEQSNEDEGTKSPAPCSKHQFTYASFIDLLPKIEDIHQTVGVEELGDSLIIEFPPEAFLSSETYPSPMEYFVTSMFRVATFTLISAAPCTNVRRRSVVPLSILGGREMFRG
jgi:hypothetical protein